MRTTWMVLTLVCSFALPGCNPRSDGVTGPDKSGVTGTVTFAGTPLAEGQVLFIDLQGEPPRQYVADIVNGHFSAPVTPGEKRVEIRSFRNEGEGASPGTPTSRIQIIPPRYNDNSDLRATVTTDGPNRFEFTLEQE